MEIRNEDRFKINFPQSLLYVDDETEQQGWLLTAVFGNETTGCGIPIVGTIVYGRQAAGCWGCSDMRVATSASVAACTKRPACVPLVSLESAVECLT
jgi:hypothetical protein